MADKQLLRKSEIITSSGALKSALGESGPRRSSDVVHSTNGVASLGTMNGHKSDHDSESNNTNDYELIKKNNDEQEESLKSSTNDYELIKKNNDEQESMLHRVESQGSIATTSSNTTTGAVSTLKELVSQSCKEFDLGTAVLPKLLFYPDVDELTELEEEALIQEQEEGGGELAAAGARKPAIPPGYVPRYAKVLEREFTSVVVEHHLKWAPLCVSEPGPLPGEQPSDRLGRYDFHHADAVVDWAIEHDMKVKGHVLCWSVTSPKFLEEMEPYQIREQLRRHIYTTIGHYRGRIKVWDVVNESLAPDGTLADNVFMRKLGPSYIEDAFRWAHDADPNAILLYNDNKVEGCGSANKIQSQKADGFYNLLYDLKVNKKVPIHGCGMQAHFNAAGTGRNRVPTPRMVKQQIRRLGKIGLKVNISEMDVRVSQLPPNVQQIAQRQIYRDILSAALSEPAFDGIWLWGFTDRHTWITHFYHDDEPLIFDEEYERKEAYYGLREALATMTPGGTVGGGKSVPLESDMDHEGNDWGHLWMKPEPEGEEEGVVGTANDGDDSDGSDTGVGMDNGNPNFESGLHSQMGWRPSAASLV